MRDGRAYLNFLSDFWTEVWGGATQLSAIAGVQAEVLNRLYLQSVAIAAPAYIDSLPLFREDFWHIVSLDANARLTDSVEVTTSGQTLLSLPEAFDAVPSAITLVRGLNRVRVTEFLVDGRRIVWSGPVLQPGDTLVLETNSWILPLDYREIPFLYNKPFEPTLVLRPTRVTSDPRDYALTVRNGATVITFTRDPFQNPDMPIRDLGAYKQIAFLAPKVYTDEKDLQQLFGDLVRIVKPTSEQYRQLIKGVMFVYVTGGVLFLLNAGLNLAAGFPVGRAKGDRVAGILYIEDPSDYIIRTVQGLEYRVPKRASLSVSVGSPLEVYSTFISDIQVMDHKSHPDWWVGLVNHIPPELSPDLNPLLRDKPEVIDHIMREYLKYSVFGLKVKTTVLQAEFNAVAEFFRVVYEVKPAFTSPYVKGYFPVVDFWTETVPWLNPDDGYIYDVPKDQATGLPIPHPIYPQDLTRMGPTARDFRLTPDDGITLNSTVDLTSMGADRWMRPLHVRLNGALTTSKRIKIGSSRASLRAQQETAHDSVSLGGFFELAETIDLQGGPAIMNSRRKIGARSRRGVIERVRIAARLELVETVDSGTWSDSVTLTAVMEP